MPNERNRGENYPEARRVWRGDNWVLSALTSWKNTVVH